MNRNVDYCKVLIIGETLHKKNGTGITLSNLFAGWPKEKIAVLSDNNIWDSDVNLCHNFYFWKIKYKLTFESFKMHFLKSGGDMSEGIISCDDILKMQSDYENGAKFTNKTSNKNWINVVMIYIFKLLLPIYRFTMEFAGLYPLTQKIEITKSLDNWLKLIKPDVIYTFLNDYKQFQFILDLNKYYKIPFIIHLGDDHIKLMPPRGLLFFYWKLKMNSKFISLINKANSCLSICDYMSRIYKNRYNIELSSISNPVEIDKWLPYSKQSWEKNDIFKILYVGRLGFDNVKVLQGLANVIDELNKGGFNIRLELRFGIFSDKAEIELFKKYLYTQIKDYISHDEINTVLPKYDLLFLPLGFDKKTRKLYSLSMSTKISEYMISGTPILVNAPENTAYFHYLKKEECGFLLPTNNKNELIKSLIELYQNESLREKLGKRAKEVAVKYHNANMVRNNLRSIFNKAKCDSTLQVYKNNNDISQI